MASLKPQKEASEELSSQGSEDVMASEEMNVGSPTVFDQSRDFNEFLNELKTDFFNAIENSTATKISDRQFIAGMKEFTVCDGEQFLDIRFRRHTAKHMVPLSFKVKISDAQTKEQQTFVKTILKPTHQRLLVLRQFIDDLALKFWRDHPNI